MSWSELVGRMTFRDGWLIYAGKLGVVAAEVLHADITAYANTVNVTSISSAVDVTFTAQLYPDMAWDKTVTGTVGDIPNVKALLALARRHPDEYAELCEGEAILKALGG